MCSMLLLAELMASMRAWFLYAKERIGEAPKAREHLQFEKLRVSTETDNFV